VTRPALEALAAHGIDPRSVHLSGRTVIKKSDVDRFLAQRESETSTARDSSDGVATSSADEVRDIPVDDPADRPTDNVAEIRLSAAQRAVAKVVSRSHTEIPAAYTVIKVYSDRLQERVHAETGSGGFVGIPEFLVKAVADRRQEFPEFFASLRESHRAALVPGAHVGVTFDLGRGLFLPVVADAQDRSVRDIAKALFAFRVSAMRGTFKQSDLDGSNIAVTFHTDEDIVHACPIVFPGHSCALSLTSVQSELWLTDAGAVASRRYFHLGVAYDHRLINGRSAAKFLQAVKRDLEA
jgi:2-oxoglutarate dehydrogenase E2 component (dihydrolipoamide succinyltransferase)